MTISVLIFTWLVCYFSFQNDLKEWKIFFNYSSTGHFVAFNFILQCFDDSTWILTYSRAPKTERLKTGECRNPDIFMSHFQTYSPNLGIRTPKLFLLA